MHYIVHIHHTQWIVKLSTCLPVFVCVYAYVHDHVAIWCVKFLVGYRMLLIILNVKRARLKDNRIVIQLELVLTFLPFRHSIFSFRFHAGYWLFIDFINPK